VAFCKTNVAFLTWQLWIALKMWLFVKKMWLFWHGNYDNVAFYLRKCGFLLRKCGFSDMATLTMWLFI
jgi:hypothetical protein